MWNWKRLSRYTPLLLLANFTTAAPSLHAEGFDGNLIPFGADLLRPASDHLVVRGIVGGRKKRYVIERDESRKCCRDKLCFSLKAEILDTDCNCKKCEKPLVPALDGKSCQNDCPSGQEKIDTPDGTVCCPKGQKPNPTTDKCEDQESCPENQKKNATSGKCEPCPNNKCDEDKCPEGQKKNVAGDKCEPCPNNVCEDEDKCPEGQKKTAAGDKCEPCPNNVCEDEEKCIEGQKKNPTSGKCEPCPNNICEDAETCAAGQKKNPTSGKCEQCPNNVCEDLDKCADGQQKNPASNKCEPCPNNKCPDKDKPDGDKNQPGGNKNQPENIKDKYEKNTKAWYTSVWRDSVKTELEKQRATMDPAKVKEFEDIIDKWDKQAEEEDRTWKAEKKKAEEDAERLKQEQRKQADEEAERQRQEQEKKNKENERKRTRLGKCLPLASLANAALAETGLSTFGGDRDALFDMTTEFFSEQWIGQSDAVLEIWPSDIDVNTIPPDEEIDSDEWLASFQAVVEANAFRDEHPEHTMGPGFRPISPFKGSKRWVPLVERRLSNPFGGKDEASANSSQISSTTALMVRHSTVHPHEKRFGNVIAAIVNLLLRAARKIGETVGSKITQRSARLKKILGDKIDKDRLFKLSKNNGDHGIDEGKMKSGAEKIRDLTDNLRKCIQGKKPGDL